MADTLPGYRPIVELSALNETVIALYNRMQGINWAALPLLITMEGVEDVELFVLQLFALDKLQRT